MDETRPPPADRTALSAVRDRLREVVDPIDRTEMLPVSTAVGRPLADSIVARRSVPHYDQAAHDGFAVRAADTAEADGSDATLFDIDDRAGPDGNGRLGPETAVRVDAGDELPEGADAVVALGDGLRHGNGLRTVAEGEVAVERSVEAGTGVRPAGADVAVEEVVRPAGHRLRPSDPALCTAVGRTRVEVVQRPTVGVVPTGGGLVSGDPGSGAVVETNGTTVSGFVERWGGKVTYRDPVSTDPHALRAAVQRDLTKDLLVTVGATGQGESDIVGSVIADLGEVLVDGVALEPGGTTTLSVVQGRPVLSVPGGPVAAFVATVQFVGPAVTRLAGRGPPVPVTVDAELDAAVDGDRGVASVRPVEFVGGGVGTDRTVRPVDDEPLSTLARADGWVRLSPGTESVRAGETVSVERREETV
ncbi:molybdopterin molybdenumtransferase MoeA [Halobacteriales archaeon QH_8_67_27]|nr:MAG: molybdopterin molybdenumtransferase MoeA [Halobacteriales archaeon QH_8_67_27]